MHGPGFTTFDYLTLSFLKKKDQLLQPFINFTLALAISLFVLLSIFLSVLTFLSHHLFPSFLALLCFPHPLCISPVLCQVGLFEVWVSDSWSRACWVGRCFFPPARLSAVCSAVWPGWRGHDIQCGNLYLMLPRHSKERRQQRPRWGLLLNYILLTGSLFCSCHSITLHFASNAKHPDLAPVTWHESVLLSLFTEKQFLLFR